MHPPQSLTHRTDYPFHARRPDGRTTGASTHPWIGAKHNGRIGLAAP